ncbi:MAG: NAD-dependent epimerase/dehydratase family protein, partial [Alphaproteobacteria bacterium]|nr:NAD-dependent epimerase/dehydratase family protein [Alphaproteobacteria bacterium]
VTPTIALLEQCARLGVRRVVFASSGGTVYGRAASLPVAETAPPAPLGAYAVSKLAIEHYLALYEHLNGLDFRVLRIANAFGPFQVAWKRQGFIAAAVARALAGEAVEVWGDGSVVRDFVFADDVVDAFAAAAAHVGNARIFNIGSGVGRSLREVIASIEQQLGRPVAVEWQRGGPVDIPASVVAVDRARDELGWIAKTSFEDALAATIDWLRAHRSDIERLSR